MEHGAMTLPPLVKGAILGNGKSSFSEPFCLPSLLLACDDQFRPRPMPLR